MMQGYILYTIFSVITAYPLKIKSVDKDLYFNVNTVAKSGVKLVESKDATVFNYQWDSDKKKHSYLKIEKNEKFALQYNKKDGGLIVYDFYNVPEQNFDFIPTEIINNTFFMVNKTKCITWADKDEKFTLEDCDLSRRTQQFIIEDIDMVAPGIEIFNNKKSIYEGETIHLSQLYDSNKIGLHMLNGIEDIANVSQMHMESDARDLLQNIYKLFYDLTSCFVDKKVCTIGGIDLQKIKKSYESSMVSSSSSSAESSAQASVVTLVHCAEYYIGLEKTDLYLQGPVGGISTSVFFGKKTTRNRYQITYEKGSKVKHSIKAVDVPGHVLDFVKSSSIFIHYPLDEVSVQTFELRPEQGFYTFRIATGTLCATWEPEEKILKNEFCTKDGKNQIFVLICANCYKKSNGEIAVGTEKYYDVDRTDEGFYDNNVISMLHAIENMSHEFTDCFAANAVCAKQIEHHPLLSFSPFSEVPSISGDWSPLQDKQISYKMLIGDKLKSGTINLDSEKVKEILENDNKKSCFDTCKDIDCNNKHSIHGKNSEYVVKGSNQLYQAQKKANEEHYKSFANEVKTLNDAIETFKKNMKTNKLEENEMSQKIQQLIESTSEKHMLPQYSDIKIHDSLHMTEELPEEEEILTTSNSGSSNSQSSFVGSSKTIADFNEKLLEQASFEERKALQSILDANKAELAKIHDLHNTYLTKKTPDEICRMMYTDSYCNQLSQFLVM